MGLSSFPCFTHFPNFLPPVTTGLFLFLCVLFFRFQIEVKSCGMGLLLLQDRGPLPSPSPVATSSSPGQLFSPTFLSYNVHLRVARVGNLGVSSLLSSCPSPHPRTLKLCRCRPGAGGADTLGAPLPPPTLFCSGPGCPSPGLPMGKAQPCSHPSLPPSPLPGTLP